MGGVFLFTGMLYFFKLAIDEGWLPPAARVAVGLIVGITALFIGYSRYKRKLTLTAELVSGLGSAIVYATIAYASFSEDIQWSANALFISMIAFTSVVTIVGVKYNMRWLSVISIIGGLITPIVIKAPEQQIFVLFLYVFILNAVSLYLSTAKSWPELRVLPFVVTCIIYITYYVYFDPESWQQPIFYISSLFVVYFIGLLISALREGNSFDGLNLYLGLINAINFIFWSIFILNTFSVPYSVPTLFVGSLYIISSLFIYNRDQGSKLAWGAHFLLGIILVSIAGADLASNYRYAGMHYAINSAIWLTLAVTVYWAGRYTKLIVAEYIAMIAWLLILLQWYTVAWDVHWVRWFGVEYIPFLNPGALVWIGLAAAGFAFAREFQRRATSKDAADENAGVIALALAIASHIVVGGLLTIQIQNFWDAYNVTFIKDYIVLSISWVIYAMVLFLWGSSTDQKPFRWMGSVVLILTSIKVFVIDLAGASTIYIVSFLMLMGLITLAISRIDHNWRKKKLQEAIENNELNQNR